MNGPFVSDSAISWRRIRAIARRHAYVLRRSPHRLFDVTVWPLVDVLLHAAYSTGAGVRVASELPARDAPAEGLGALLRYS